MTEKQTIETLFLWDIDGTILRAKGAGRRAMNTAFQTLFQVEGAFDNIAMAGSLDLYFINEIFKQRHIPKDELEAFLDAYYSALQEECTEDQMDLLPGVKDILGQTEPMQNVYHALGTGNLEVGARIKLDVYGLNEYFPVGGFCERLVERYEVLQNGVDQARAFYGVDFLDKNVIVIGDTTKDIAAARKIRARVIAVATGGSSYDELQEADPDLLLEDLSDTQPVFDFCGLSL